MNNEENLTTCDWPLYEEPAATDQTHIPSVWYS